MKKDRFLKVFAASGYYDLNTSYFATAYTLDHLGLEADLRPNVTAACYPQATRYTQDRLAR